MKYVCTVHKRIAMKLKAEPESLVELKPHFFGYPGKNSVTVFRWRVEVGGGGRLIKCHLKKKRSKPFWKTVVTLAQNSFARKKPHFPAL
jgi:hypothetical protein